MTAAAAALAQPVAGTLRGLLFLAAAVWTGGLVTIFVVARVAQRTLRPGERVAFFRMLGRAYGPIGGISLIVVIGCGAALLSGRAWDGTLTAAAVITASLVAITVTGMAQARSMTRLRQAALQQSANAELAGRLRRGTARAAGLRGGIAALTLALVVVGVLVVS